MDLPHPFFLFVIKAAAVASTAKEEYPHRNPEHIISFRIGETSIRKRSALKIPHMKQEMRLAANMLAERLFLNPVKNLFWQNLKTVPKAEVTTTRNPIHMFAPQYPCRPPEERLFFLPEEARRSPPDFFLLSAFFPDPRNIPKRLNAMHAAKFTAT